MTKDYFFEHQTYQSSQANFECQAEDSINLASLVSIIMLLLAEIQIILYKNTNL